MARRAAHVERDEMSDHDEDIPEHLRQWPGLFVRQGSRIVEASSEDRAVARNYPLWPDKGPLEDGRRITLLMRDAAYGVNEEIHIIHVYEVVVPGRLVSVMG